MNKKKVLMIAYYYPPKKAVGKNRTLRFEKWLSKFGYEVVIHTSKTANESHHKNKDLSIIGKPIYRSYEANFKPIANIINWFSNQIFNLMGKDVAHNPVQRFLFIPDLEIGWIPGCLFKSLSVLKKENIDLIYVSCSPFSAALTGAIIKKITKTPLAIDLRDPWSFNNHLPRIAFTRKIHKVLERFVIKNSDLWVANTKTSAHIYRSIYPEYQSKIFHVYNGYNRVAISFSDKKLFSNEMQLLYTGALYDRKFLEIMILALKDSPNVRMIITGRQAKWAHQLAREYKIENQLILTGYIEYSELCELYAQSDFLIFHNGFKNQSELNSEVIKSKLYDYLSSGIPMLCLAPKGEPDDLIRKYSDQAIIINKPNVERIKKAINSAYEMWKNGMLKKETNGRFLIEFSDEYLTCQLASLFGKIQLVDYPFQRKTSSLKDKK